MDAIALLENLGIEVKAVGLGKVKTQSLQAGQDIMKNTTNTYCDYTKRHIIQSSNQIC
jgi:cell division protein FtsI (penicillin-binding protein 3)